METTFGKLTAQRRTTTGKEAAAKLRAAGKIPAVCYGHKQDPIALTVDPLELKKALDPAKRQNTLIDLTVEHEGQREQMSVMLKDYQVDDLKHVVLHADFVRVAADQVVEVPVPLLLDGKPEGVKAGGTLHQVFRTLPVVCVPGKIPSAISGDVSALQIGQALQVKGLVALPEGVKIKLPDNQTIAIVIAPRKIEEAAPAEGVAAEGATPAEGAEGAPAEGAKEEAPAEAPKGKGKKERE
jgi:large subunit ribosomal protein L25